MKKALWLFLMSCCCGLVVSAQTVVVGPSIPLRNNLKKLVETELNFARMAAEKGMKTAFLTFLADDGLIFSPEQANGKLVWKARPESSALLAWNPVWADISSDGALGYTTGGWEFRPQGKTDKPTAFGEYVTIWEKQPDGSFKAVLDIGITHPEKSLSKAAWKSPADAGLGAKNVGNGVTSDTLTEIFSNKSLANGYFNFLAEDTIVLREGNLPFAGKQTAFIGLEKLESDFPLSSFLNFTGNTSKIHGNMMYIWGVYQLTNKDKTLSRWNFLQIWKHRAGRWQIVLDVFNQIPKEKQ